MLRNNTNKFIIVLISRDLFLFGCSYKPSRIGKVCVYASGCVYSHTIIIYKTSQTDTYIQVCVLCLLSEIL